MNTEFAESSQAGLGEEYFELLLDQTCSQMWEHVLSGARRQPRVRKPLGTVLTACGFKAVSASG